MSNCPNILSSGTCPDALCEFNHTPFTCIPCKYIFATEELLEIHLSSPKHQSVVSGRSQSYYCSLCNKNMGSSSWNGHIKGIKHRTIATRQGVSPSIAPLRGTTNESQTYCGVCQYASPNYLWARHVNSRNHIAKESFLKYRSALDESEKDKNGLSIEGATDLGFIDPVRVANGRTAVRGEFIIKSSEPLGKSVLLEIRFVSTQGGRPVNSGFSVASATLKSLITLRAPVAVVYHFKAKFIGRYEDRLEFKFEDTLLRKKFIISRSLQVIIGNQVDHDALKPISPYVPPERKARVSVQDVVEGVPPPSASAIRYLGRLPDAFIPRHLLDLLSGSDITSQQVSHIKRLYLSGQLSSANYTRTFKHLLWIEEHRTEADLARYDMPDVTLQRHNQYYYLNIPGLAEKRPSVLVGDRILVQKNGAAPGHYFEGHVHVLRQSEVGLVFHSSFSGWTPSQAYNVRFKLNRIVLRRQHSALDSAFEEERVLFPLQAHVRDIGPIRRLAFFNPLIAGNSKQLETVNSIVHQRAGSPPFVVFGPPGTGKTVTIVETIRQVLRANPESKILACAPSNSAADLIAERLAAGSGSLTPKDMFRMYAPSRFRNQVPDALGDYTCATLNGHFSIPIMAKLKSFRVVVATCVAASMLSGVGIPRGHFSHIFIDEAGQATEPEAFISIKTLAATQTNIILSGDPKQLGPIIRSGIARQLGLETSYLERLMDRQVYDVRAGHAKTVVKLTQNFRSHAAILKFPNERFYAGDLEECARASTINSYLSFPILPSPDFPVIFHSVMGKDDREAASPSFFNIEEALQIKSYVRSLKEARGKFRTSDGDIGIITPYHAQCLKLRAALRSVADGIKVGSVEEFQGQERKVIMISTVRSSKDFVTYDLKHTLGFVANPRRFNVAVTRAQALLIVVGNPHVLSLDPLWRSFLNFIYINGGWTGPDIPWDPEAPVDPQGAYDAGVRNAAQMDMNEFTRRMEELVGSGSAEEGGDADTNIDRPWRDVE